MSTKIPRTIVGATMTALGKVNHARLVVGDVVISCPVALVIVEHTNTLYMDPETMLPLPQYVGDGYYQFVLPGGKRYVGRPHVDLAD